MLIRYWWLPQIRDNLTFILEASAAAILRKGRLADLYGVETIRVLGSIEKSVSLQEIMDFGYALLGNPMFFQNIELGISCYTQTPAIEVPVWQDWIVGGRMNYHALQARLPRDRQGVLLPPKLQPHYLQHDLFGRIRVMPLSKNHMNFGILVLTEFSRPITQEDEPLFALFGEMFLTKLMRGVELHATGKSFLDSILFMLMDGSEVSEELLAESLENMSWKPERYLWVLNVREREKRSTGTHLGDIVERFSHSGQCKPMIFEGSVVCLYTGSAPQIDLEELDALLRRGSQPELCMGVSDRFQDLRKLRTYYLEAAFALRSGMELLPEESLFQYNLLRWALPLEHWIRGGNDPEMMLSPELLQLCRNDRENHTELFETLQCYFACGMDAARTAERLFVHKNTVRYRIQQCQEILHLDLSDGEAVFACMLAMKATLALKQRPPEQPEE